MPCFFFCLVRQIFFRRHWHMRNTYFSYSLCTWFTITYPFLSGQRTGGMQIQTTIHLQIADDTGLSLGFWFQIIVICSLQSSERQSVMKFTLCCHEHWRNKNKQTKKMLNAWTAWLSYFTICAEHLTPFFLLHWSGSLQPLFVNVAFALVDYVS